MEHGDSVGFSGNRALYDFIGSNEADSADFVLGKMRAKEMLEGVYDKMPKAEKHLTLGLAVFAPEQYLRHVRGLMADKSKAA